MAQQYERIVPDFDEVNPRFIAYCKAHNLAPGDTWITHEYMTWVHSKAAEFRKLKRLGAQDFISKLGADGHDKFTEWLVSAND